MNNTPGLYYGLHFDRVIVDTAPTGHTLRLLAFPEFLDRFIERLLILKDRFRGASAALGGISSVLKTFGGAAGGGAAGGGSAGDDAEESTAVRARWGTSGTTANTWPRLGRRWPTAATCTTGQAST